MLSFIRFFNQKERENLHPKNETIAEKESDDDDEEIEEEEKRFFFFFPLLFLSIKIMKNPAFEKRKRRKKRFYACVSTPLDDATPPPLLGSLSHACLKARANALKVASTMWCELVPASCRMCKVIPEVLTTDWKKCSTSCVSYVPILSVGSLRSQERCGLPLRSSTTWTRASSKGAEKSPKRTMPRRSPKARARAVPKAKATSSFVWWSSIQVSPVALTATSNSPCEASWSIMWSRKGIEEREEQAPVPSSVMATSTEVSLVTRETAAWRTAEREGAEEEGMTSGDDVGAAAAAEEVRRTRRRVRLEAG